MDHTIAEEYKSSLNDLNFNSKPLINMLTMLADENKKHAPLIVNTIISHINSVSLESKLPGLYLVDSIIKNLGNEYLKIFCEHIASLFSTVFEKVDENIRSQMFKLRQTWTGILPNKILYNLDTSVKKLDPAWPVTAKNPSKRILINPKFLDGAVEEKKESDTPNNALKTEESKIKQRQGEVLKQLLAKQEQLRQLELKKLQLTMKRKTTTVGSTGPSVNSFTQNHIRDPRMVKINNMPQNITTQRAVANSVLQGKPTPNLEIIPPVSNVPVQGKSTVCSKPEVQPNIDNRKSNSNVSSNQNTYASNEEPVLHKKGSPKSKCDKIGSNRNKLSTFKDKTEAKCTSIESSINLPKTDVSSKNETNFSKTNVKSPREYSKGSKGVSKKKNVNSDTSKISHVPIDTSKRKAHHSSQKNEKLKPPQNSELKDNSFYKDKKVSNNHKNDSGVKTINSENPKIKKDVKLHEPVDTAKSIPKTNTYVKDEPARLKAESHQSEIANILEKDEDLRTNPAILNEETASKRLPKREIMVSNSSIETEKIQPPNKKMKSDDIENCNPDFRTHSPILFGNEDQDLRQSTNSSVNDVKSKDWTQYKASHPDEYSPGPGRQEYSGGKFRSRKYHFSNFKQYPEYDRRRPFRYARDRYVPRRNVRRMHFPRGFHGRPFYNSSVGPVMFDSYAFLQQAEEKYHSGRISESEYLDIRHDLQKMVESNNQFFANHVPKMQNIDHAERNPEIQRPREEHEETNIFPVENLRMQEIQRPREEQEKNVFPVENLRIQEIQRPREEHEEKNIFPVENLRIQEIQRPREEHEEKSIFPVENLRIQGPSINLPTIKPFVLDGKDRLIHFVEDKALILMDDKDPRELTFKGEPKTVFIEGVTTPLSLGFDGKSVEFEVDGRRHILRLGVPGRELYINNHPYELKFGGPPIAARLEDGHIYKIHVSGPPPQVVIGDKSEYELFGKFHGNIENPVFKQGLGNTSEKMEQETPFIAPESSCSSLQDIDMRVKPEIVQQPDVLLNKDNLLYDKDMKDIDWRHIPPASTNLESDKNLPRVYEDNVPDNFGTWSEEDNYSRTAYHEDRNNQSQQPMPKDSLPYPWEPPQSHQSLHSNINVPTASKEENWYDKEHNKAKWQYRDYRHNGWKCHPEYQPPSNDRQHFENRMEHYDDPVNNSNRPYYERKPFLSNQARGQDFRSSYGPWLPNVKREPSHNESINQRQRILPPPPQKALLPTPDFPPDYSHMVDTSVLPQSKATTLPEISEAQAPGVPCVPGSFGSEIPPTKSSSSNVVDVESLLQKLITAGIINTKPTEEPIVKSEIPVSEIADVKEEEIEEPVEEIPEIQLTPEGLKVHNPGVISVLHKGMQCATCGMRFKELQSEQYSRHLDWHFRMNRKEKDGAKKVVSRQWYYEIDDWVQFEEFEDFVERVPSYFELQADNGQSDVIEAPVVVSVPATNDDQESCPVCSERFQLFWVEEEEEWHFRDAVRHDNITYHPACYEDFKKVSETEKADSIKNVESNSGDEAEIDEDVITLINTLLDDVHDKIEAESEIHSEVEPSNSTEIAEEVPSVEDHSEEEMILEGKPGEEEIIGLISDSDMEVDANIPISDSKMVVMQSGGITLKVKAESLQCHSPSNQPEKETKQGEDKPLAEEEEIDFRPPTPDPRFEVRPLVSRGRELSGLCCIM